MTDFSIQLKSGDGKASTARVVGYNKAFTGHRFVYSTGIKVPRKGFNEAKPGKAIKNVLEAVEKAYRSILDDGTPLNNVTLKARTDLYKNGMQWSGGELHVYDGKKHQSFDIPEDINRTVLEMEVKQEMTKHAPNPAKVITSITSEGTNELFGFWKAVLDGQIQPRSGKPLRKSTVDTKTQTYRIVKEFRPTAMFSGMDRKFYNAFTGWMTTEKGFDENTQGKHIKELKSILHLASANELISDSRFSYWPVTKLNNEVVALSKDEVLKISDLQLSGTIDDVRDLFVLAMFTGARISDFKKFTRENIVVQAGITYLEYITEKTGIRVKVPLHPIAVRIIEKRAGELPKMIAEQNFREYVKKIAKKAELFERVVIKIRDGKAPEYSKKWEAISPHSARRTFASSLFYGWFGKAMPASICMRFTGHRSEKSFLLYIGASDTELDKKALEYFDLQPVMKVVS